MSRSMPAAGKKPHAPARLENVYTSGRPRPGRRDDAFLVTPGNRKLTASLPRLRAGGRGPAPSAFPASPRPAFSQSPIADADSRGRPVLPVGRGHRVARPSVPGAVERGREARPVDVAVRSETTAVRHGRDRVGSGDERVGRLGSGRDACRRIDDPGDADAALEQRDLGPAKPNPSTRPRSVCRSRRDGCALPGRVRGRR